MGRQFLEWVDDDACAKFTCTHCSCDLASEGGLLWEGLMGACQPALLFRAAVNVENVGPQRQEVLSTGRYTLQDVRCRSCRAGVGWQYLKAEVADQKYKEGAFLLQQSALTRVHSGCQPASASLAPPQLLAQLARLRA